MAQLLTAYGATGKQLYEHGDMAFSGPNNGIRLIGSFPNALETTQDSQMINPDHDHVAEELE